MVPTGLGPHSCLDLRCTQTLLGKPLGRLILVKYFPTQTPRTTPLCPLKLGSAQVSEKEDTCDFLNCRKLVFYSSHLTLKHV